MPITLEVAIDVARQHPLPVVAPDFDNERFYSRYVPANIRQARSMAATQAERSGSLEWLGDGIISSYAVMIIYQCCPGRTPRLLDAIKVQITNNATLGLLGEAYGLGERIYTDTLKTGGRPSAPYAHPKLLANCLEASIGAAAVSGNLDGARKWVEGVMAALCLHVLADTESLVDGGGNRVLLEPGSHGTASSQRDSSYSTASSNSSESTASSGFSTDASSVEPASAFKQQEPAQPKVQLTGKVKQLLINQLNRLGQRANFSANHQWRTSIEINGLGSVEAVGESRAEADQLAAAEAFRKFYPDALSRLHEVEEEEEAVRRSKQGKPKRR